MLSSTPFYICLGTTEVSLVDRNNFLESGVENSLVIRFTPTDMYMDIKSDGPVIIDFPILTPDNYRYDKIEPIREKLSELKGLVYES